MKAPLGTKMLA